MEAQRYAGDRTHVVAFAYRATATAYRRAVRPAVTCVLVESSKSSRIRLLLPGGRNATLVLLAGPAGWVDARPLAAGLVLELVVLIGFAVSRQAVSDPGHWAGRVVLIVVAAVAMGFRGRRFSRYESQES